jgi:hypothetical protein
MRRLFFIQIIGLLFANACLTKEKAVPLSFPRFSNIGIESGELYPNDNTITYWVRLGIGKSYFGPTLGGNLSYAPTSSVFTLRYFKADEIRFNPGGYDYDEPALNIKELGLLYGRSSRKESLVLIISGGIGYLNGIDRGREIRPGEFEKVEISTIGFAIEAEFRIELKEYVGIGGSFFGNLNSRKSFMGGMVNIHVGKLR